MLFMRLQRLYIRAVGVYRQKFRIFSRKAGFGGALTGNSGGLLVPVFGTSAEENPTISIAPIQGEEFTQRLLTPFQEQKLTKSCVMPLALAMGR
jgi:hypothetical protein